jgi:type II pantothenate kinase
VPDFVRFLHESHILERYKPELLAAVRATGGGATKYAPLVEKELGVRLNAVKEMDSIVAGLNALLRYAPHCIFTFEPDNAVTMPHRLGLGPSFPCLVVNIGSGVSIVKVLDQDGRYERVGGSAIGGATFWGLVRTMTSIKTWDEVLEITRVDGPGDNTNVDLLVGDIYGFNAKDLPSMLSVDTVASTFGKFGTNRPIRGTTLNQRRLSDLKEDALPCDDEEMRQDSPLAAAIPSDGAIGARSSIDSPPLASSLDIVRSLLIMIANNVTQLAYLHSQSSGTPHVFFTGGFVRENPIVWRQITRSLNYWSKGQMAAHFLSHDGYLGAFGALTIKRGDEPFASK